MTASAGLRFYKMSGSGNDFIVVDARDDPHEELRSPAVIQRLSARGTGIGADGLVLLAAEPGADFRMIYYNADGSRASMCGNAALCCTALAAQLAPGFRDVLCFETDSGPVTGRVVDGRPEIDLAAVTNVQPQAPISASAGESLIGYAVAGVPHLTVVVDDVANADVSRRGRELRSSPELAPDGANANFVSSDGPTWAIRTYERGIEGETLACGTGAVASAILLRVWGFATGDVDLKTRSGRVLTVKLRQDGTTWLPTLAGEGRIVFMGETPSA